MWAPGSGRHGRDEPVVSSTVDAARLSMGTTNSDGAAAIEVRGLGFDLTAATLRALLDPASRGQAEVSVDLSALAIDVPAAAIDEVAKRVAPELAVDLAPDALIVRLPDAPAVRVTLPATGVRVRVGERGVRVGGGDSGGG